MEMYHGTVKFSMIVNTIGLMVTILLFSYLVLFPLSNLAPYSRRTTMIDGQSSDVVQLRNDIGELTRMLEFSREASVVYSRIIISSLLAVLVAFLANLFLIRRMKKLDDPKE